jgi:hypothetical protein
VQTLPRYDQRINDRKSTILYFGLMVFLGLLGVHGPDEDGPLVSDLIGAMDVSGKGGTDSFAR